MLMTDIQPTTLVGVKRLAAELRNKLGIKHSDALDRAARSANCENFRHAQRTLPASGVAMRTVRRSASKLVALT